MLQAIVMPCLARDIDEPEVPCKNPTLNDRTWCEAHDTCRKVYKQFTVQLCHGLDNDLISKEIRRIKKLVKNNKLNDSTLAELEPQALKCYNLTSNCLQGRLKLREKCVHPQFFDKAHDDAIAIVERLKDMSEGLLSNIYEARQLIAYRILPAPVPMPIGIPQSVSEQSSTEIPSISIVKRDEEKEEEELLRKEIENSQRMRIKLEQKQRELDRKAEIIRFTTEYENIIRSTEEVFDYIAIKCSYVWVGAEISLRVSGQIPNEDGREMQLRGSLMMLLQEMSRSPLELVGMMLSLRSTRHILKWLKDSLATDIDFHMVKVLLEKMKYHRGWISKYPLSTAWSSLDVFYSVLSGKQRYYYIIAKLDDEPQKNDLFEDELIKQFFRVSAKHTFLLMDFPFELIQTDLVEEEQKLNEEWLQWANQHQAKSSQFLITNSQR